ncbi:MAG: hypothetical protein NC548_40280 [Lachnospiraceae bacterium]|nr:hypothetical protein [Lachnospiraceae bacterium]
MKPFKPIIAIPLLWMGACGNTDELMSGTSETDATAKIVICGGSANTGTSTRATTFEEPQNYGSCNANKIRIWTFRGTHTGGDVEPSVMRGTAVSYDIDLSKWLNPRDKWTTQSVDLSISNSTRTGYAFPAIAYSKGDNYTIDSSTYEGMSLSINGSNTPELYFGRLKPNKDSHFSDGKYDLNGISYEINLGGNKDVNGCKLSGTLYRIVSQLNVTVTDVNVEAVDKIEMYLSNVPTQIGLFANHRSDIEIKKGDKNVYHDHGFFYPVVIASGEAQHTIGETLVCTKEIDTESNVKLSTFLLPSDRGREIKLKLYLNDGSTIERTVRTAHDHYLSNETSLVYYSNEPLIAYKASESQFYSYSNVRINVSGKFDDIFAQESNSNVVIEVCPNYDKKHDEITIQ